MAKQNIKIESAKEYNAMMKKIDLLMKKGENNLSSADANRLRSMAMQAQLYEKNIYKIPAPKTLQGIIELKMYERHLKQKELAKLLGIGEPKLSQILKRKRPVDVAFLKAAHEHLGIDGNLLLEFA